MRVPVFIGSACATAAALALLAGCAGNNSPLATPTSSSRIASQPANHRYEPMMMNGARSVLPAGFKPNQHRPPWMKTPPPKAPKGNLAVAQFGGSSVLWFQKNNPKNKQPTVCEPASSTNGIRVDPSGNLWVPDGRADTTTEYAPNCGAAVQTIPDPTGEPADVTFDSKGNVYIMNINDLSGPPTVAVYNASGAQIATLGDPSFHDVFGIGTDSHDNVFVSNLTTSNIGNVIEFVGGAMPGVALSGVSLNLPGSPVFDASNNMIITDWGRGTIDVFAPPYTGSPTTSPLMGFAIWCPLGHNETRLFCGDAENGAIDVYKYPGGKYLYSYNGGLSASAFVTGVAPSPAAPF